MAVSGRVLHVSCFQAKKCKGAEKSVFSSKSLISILVVIALSNNLRKTPLPDTPLSLHIPSQSIPMAWAGGLRHAAHPWEDAAQSHTCPGVGSNQGWQGWLPALNMSLACSSQVSVLDPKGIIRASVTLLKKSPSMACENRWRGCLMKNKSSFSKSSLELLSDGRQIHCSILLLRPNARGKYKLFTKDHQSVSGEKMQVIFSSEAVSGVGYWHPQEDDHGRGGFPVNQQHSGVSHISCLNNTALTLLLDWAS